MRVAIAQVNPTVGDLAGNRRLVEEAAAKAASERADLVALPEMVLSGYPPMDLLEREGFVRDQLRELDALLPASEQVPIALGAVVPAHDPPGPARLWNAAVLLAGGRRVAVRPKSLLPTYDVFDEKRYFAPARDRETVPFQGGPLGLSVCEDTWVEQMGYALDPVAELAGAGAAVVLNLSCSPWHVGKAAERRSMIADLAARHGVPIVFANQVGGNDELVFDGGSFATRRAGPHPEGTLPLFESALRDRRSRGSGRPAPTLDEVSDPDAVAQLETGLVARHPRLLPQAGASAGRGDRPVGRHRFGPDGAPRRRGARARAGARARSCRDPSLRSTACDDAEALGEPARHRGTPHRHHARCTRPTWADLRRALRRAPRLRQWPSRTSSRASAARS